ncbi:MAG: TldD/PmbA family protein [Bdellovibrio sp.]|nr:TldD/PmbA family protein [Bdellovibrio sp.]
MQTENNQNLFVAEFKKYKSEADFVAFKTVSEKSRDYTVRNGKPDQFYESNDSGLLIEVMKNGHIGYGATSEFTSEGINHAFKKAMAMTTAAEKNSVFKFTEAIRPPSKGSYETLRSRKLDQLSLGEVYDFLKKTSLALKTNDKIISATSDVMLIETTQNYLSSAGAEFTQDFDIIVNSMQATARDGAETQTRSLHGGRGNCLQAGAEYFNLDKALQECEQISREVLELLTADNCPSETCDVILAPDQMLLQIHESIGHPLELDRILGDERNFAGWSFVEAADFGKLQYGSKMMNVVFDPTVAHELASYKFDEAGNPAHKKYLIKDGILQAGLGSLESQMRSNLSGVANSRSSSWNRAPIDRMANINLESGDKTLEQMIASVERGVIMFSNKSWSIDDYRRKFQFGCEYGRLIENGKLTKILKNPNYRGVTVPFWNSLSALSNTTETYGSPYCGKGEPSQVIRVGHASPYALFKNIEVFGGG